MARKIKKIKYKKERVVLADILPYEVPIIFSNRHFYDFLVENNIDLSDSILRWKKSVPQLDEVMRLIFGVDIIHSHGNTNSSSYNRDKYSIPFKYKITHKESEFRELAVVHPANQTAIIDFYSKYKELILYYCSKSPYSIRRPFKIASFKYFNDNKHKERKAEEPDREIIEIFGKEYKNLKTFFTYNDYSNIQEFYESYAYHRCEKKYNELYKFDISKCFDSIYTHSLSWALMNKEIVKELVTENDRTFSGSFDRLMQKLNYNETNGIVIGPEFSRIFAEILFQQIEFKIYCQLENDGIFNKTHYELFRYVDDYFLFFNDENYKNSILELFKVELKKYNLYINESKSHLFQKPIITELTIAKEKISNLLNDRLVLTSETITGEILSDENEEDNIQVLKTYNFRFDSKKVIIDFKTIIKETGIEYKDIINYTLSIIDRKLFRIYKKYDKALFKDVATEEKFKLTFIKSLISILDFSFFIYSVSPRVNSTIKLCTILSKLTKFIKEKKDEKNKKYFKMDYVNMVFKKVFDDSTLILKNSNNTEFTQIESLYMLTSLYDLGKPYRIDKEALLKYLNIKTKTVNKRTTYEFPYIFSYWTIAVLLFYMRNLVRYNDIKIALKNHILDKYELEKNNIGIKTEMILMTLDLLSCPYLDESDQRFKIKLLNYHGFSRIQNVEKINIINYIKAKKQWFIKWENFNFEQEFNTKKSQEVY